MRNREWKEQGGTPIPEAEPQREDDWKTHNMCPHGWEKHKMLTRGLYGKRRNHIGKDEYWCTVPYCRCHYWSQA